MILGMLQIFDCLCPSVAVQHNGATFCLSDGLKRYFCAEEDRTTSVWDYKWFTITTSNVFHCLLQNKRTDADAGQGCRREADSVVSLDREEKSSSVLHQTTKTRGAGQSIIPNRCTDTCRMHSQWPRNQESARCQHAETSGSRLRGRVAEFSSGTRNATHRRLARNKRCGPIRAAQFQQSPRQTLGWWSLYFCPPPSLTRWYSPSALCWALHRHTIKANDHQRGHTSFAPHFIFLAFSMPSPLPLLFLCSVRSSVLYRQSNLCAEVGGDFQWLFLVCQLKGPCNVLMEPAWPRCGSHPPAHPWCYLQWTSSTFHGPCCGFI